MKIPTNKIRKVQITLYQEYEPIIIKGLHVFSQRMLARQQLCTYCKRKWPLPKRTPACRGKMVTPHDGGRCILPPLTFGNFLPPEFQFIPEEVEDSSLEVDSPTSVHLRSFGTSCPNRKLQFSGVSTATIPQVKKEF
ncbi:hypothetical protein KY290_007836 [Solanum tuberosum]|uniref:Uncharacterized protein n=1 Tax=Solanum tuberosum TaxID=4113 RepID=A0ABQ7W6Q0_SOLTU|nr:hypothetical protein KY290_007836 [Solanum tuberosum]